MSFICHIFFTLLIISAVVPEFIYGVPASENTNLNHSIRQAAGCTGRCFGRVQNANRDCRLGFLSGRECRVQRCDRGRPNRGFQCVFVRLAPPPPPSTSQADGTCPNRCFVPGMASLGNIQGAQSFAERDCIGAAPPCIVRTCFATPLNGFTCARPCPNLCRNSRTLAENDCAGTVGCVVQSCNPPAGTAFACVAPTATTQLGSMVSASPSPSMSLGASPSVTSTVTPSPSASPTGSVAASPSPTTTVSPTPSPSCEFSVGTIGSSPATAFCRCGTRTETVTVPAAVDNVGMPLDVADEVTGGNNYRDCVVRDLRALCTNDQVNIFSSTGTTRVGNCCTTNVVDGMGLDSVTNQCRIGDGCAPITMLGTTTLVMPNQMITCSCSGRSEMVRVLNIVSASGTVLNDLAPGQGDNAEAYNTCLQTSLSALCTSGGISTFVAMGDTAVSACCSATPNGAGGAVMGTAPTQDCVVT